MIGIGIVTFDREEKFNRVLNSIELSSVGRIIAVKDGGKPPYKSSSLTNKIYEYYEMSDNIGVGRCKNFLIEKLLEKGCEDIFLLEDDCLIKDNGVWEYCLSFKNESGLLHFNWNDYRFKRILTAEFDKHKAAICSETEGNFSYFHKDFLKEIRFDENFKNAWEHIEIEIQGEVKGFLPAFRLFVSPSELSNYLELIDDGVSTIFEDKKAFENVKTGHDYFVKKWGRGVNEWPRIDYKTFYSRMKEITIKYANRNNH